MRPRRALVTGASRGIGRAIAEKFAAAGFELIVPSHRELDLADDASLGRYLQGLTAPLDVLVNNAGINPLGEIAAARDEDIAAVLQLDLVAPLKLARAVVPLMAREKYGRIVNVSSVWSVVAKPGRGVYAAAKAGLNALTRALAVETAGSGILVNSVSPGFVDTELTRRNLTAEQIEQITAQVPLGRLAEPAEVAELVLFLASERNTYLTGQNLLIDGGYTCL